MNEGVNHALLGHGGFLKITWAASSIIWLYQLLECISAFMNLRGELGILEEMMVLCILQAFTICTACCRIK